MPDKPISGLVTSVPLPWWEKRQKPTGDTLDTRERTDLLRTIRALVDMPKLTDDRGRMPRGAAGRVARKLATQGFGGPKERTLRNFLNEAANLKPEK